MKRTLAPILAVLALITGILIGPGTPTASASIDGDKIKNSSDSYYNKLLIAYDSCGSRTAKYGTPCKGTQTTVITRGQTATCPHDGGHDCDLFWLGAHACVRYFLGATEITYYPYHWVRVSGFYITKTVTDVYC